MSSAKHARNSTSNRTDRFDSKIHHDDGGKADSQASYYAQGQQQMTSHHGVTMPAFNPAVPPPGFNMVPSLTGYPTSQNTASNPVAFDVVRYSSYGCQVSGQIPNTGLPLHNVGHKTLSSNHHQFAAGTNASFYSPQHNAATTFTQGQNLTSNMTHRQNSNQSGTSTMNSSRQDTQHSRNNSVVPYQPQHNNQVFNKHQRHSIHTSNYTMHSTQPSSIVHSPTAQNLYPGSGGSTSSYYNPYHPPVVFPPRNNSVPPFLPPNYPQPTTLLRPPTSATSQEDVDKNWVDEWLKQHEIKKDVTPGSKNTRMKIGDVQQMVEKCSELSEQLRNGRDDLIQNIEMPESEWKDCLARMNAVKEELLSAQKILSDPTVVENLQEKIHKRRKKRVWFKNRMKRRHFEKMEHSKRRERLHKEIDEWQKEKIEKDVAARKEAALKREAGGVLGEVRRKQTDGRKLLELLASIKKLREIRKSEGEKKGVYPKTSSENDRKFSDRSEYVEKFITERIKGYEDEEKALRVMLVEEEEEKEKKNEQERMEQKALLNLSKDKEPDALADFRRYYNQSEQGVEFLVQIRRDWDAYIAPGHVFGASRIPDDEIAPSSPSSDLWSAVLQQDCEISKESELVTL